MSGETPLWKPPLLEDHDVSAVMGMLIRVVRLDDANKIDKELLAKLTSDIADRTAERAKHLTGLAAFGFDMTGPEVWSRIRNTIGDAKYSQAVAIARAPKKSTGVTNEIGSEQKVLEAPASDDTGEGPEEAEQEIPKVRDAILTYLRTRPDGEGAQVPIIKQYLSDAFGIETHDKTPGMTLYRLSKEGLVSRSGRTWFAVKGATIDGQQLIKAGTVV